MLVELETLSLSLSPWYSRPGGTTSCDQGDRSSWQMGAMLARESVHLETTLTVLIF